MIGFSKHIASRLPTDKMILYRGVDSGYFRSIKKKKKDLKKVEKIKTNSLGSWSSNEVDAKIFAEMDPAGGAVLSREFSLSKDVFSSIFTETRFLETESEFILPQFSKKVKVKKVKPLSRPFF